MGGGLTALLASSPSFAAVCGLTLPQQEGPYYPEGDLERDSDLVVIHSGDPQAKGQIIYLTGTVTNEKCEKLSGALVEIWQACFSGKYSHSEDPNNLELDPNFQYWGRAHTDSQGKYKFRSVVPGYYPNTPTTYRPPHIHFKTHAKGHLALTTQMYFDPTTFDNSETAAFVKKWNDYERVPKSLIIPFSPIAAGRTATKAGVFDIVLRPNR